jgi:hypothetical protein
MKKLFLLFALALGAALPAAAQTTPSYVPTRGGTMTGSLTAPQVNGVLNANACGGAQVPSWCSGSNMGAWITAADTYLGASCGMIVVPPGLTGVTVTTAPALSACHTLSIQSPMTWAAGVTLASNTAIEGAGAAALQTLPAGAWITASSITGFSVDNLWVTNPNTTNAANQMLHCKACHQITVRRVHAESEGIVFTDSTQTSYSLVNSGNISTDVAVTDNYLDGQGDQVNLGTYYYTQHVTASGNRTFNAQYGSQWWGGDANNATGNGAVGNTRWVQDVNISNSLDVNVRAGEWGSMGQDVTVSGATVDTCSDVGLDAEGSYRVTFSGFTVRNCVNGGLATFFLSQNVSFGPGVVTSDTSASTLFWLKNVSDDPTLSFAISIRDVRFNCGDGSTLCVGGADPIGGLDISDNSFTNSTVTFGAVSGMKVSGNSFRFTYAPGSAFSAFAGFVIGTYSTQNEVKRNTFASTVTQSSGSYAINISNSDANTSDTVTLDSNQTSGFTNDAVLIAASTNAGITPVYLLSKNLWGSNSVTKTITGVNGSFINSAAVDTLVASVSVSSPITIGTQAVAITAKTAAGTGATAICYSGAHCTLSSGFVQVTTGTSPTIGSQFGVATTGSALPNLLNCVVTSGGGGPGTPSAALLSPGVVSNTTSGFQGQLNVAPAASTIYYYSYACAD